MSIQKHTVFNFSDIETKKVSLKHQNAFIFPNGQFCLANGYMGANHSQQLESSALQFSEEILQISNIKKKYEIHLNSLVQKGASLEEIELRKFYYIRNILVEFYGYGLFARIQRMDVEPYREQFWDCSMLPDPKYYGKTATKEQLNTLQELFKINNDGTLLPNWNIEIIEKQFRKKRK